MWWWKMMKCDDNNEMQMTINEEYDDEIKMMKQLKHDWW
jgi:hypothetical protein